MVQFYFLSIVCNALIGYALVKDRAEFDEPVPLISLDNETFRLALGFGSLIIALLKILSAFRGDLRIIGDLLPALTGLAGGGSLIFEYYYKKASISSEGSDRLAITLAAKRKWIGIAALVAGALHFLFPQALFL